MSSVSRKARPRFRCGFINMVIEPPRSIVSRMIFYAVAAAFVGLFLSVLVVLGYTITQPWLSQRDTQTLWRAPARSANNSAKGCQNSYFPLWSLINKRYRV